MGGYIRTIAAKAMSEIDHIERPRPQDVAPFTVFGVVCSGGGVMGAYQVGVLRYIHERFAIDDRSPFQIYTGISCGSINAAFSATTSHCADRGSRRLEELWRRFHVPDYQKGVGELIRRSVFRGLFSRRTQKRRYWSALDPIHMWELFDREISRDALEEAFRIGSTLGLALVARESTKNRSTWFAEGPLAVEWRRHNGACRICRLGTEHVVASCSVPFYFPPVPLDDGLYLDGAVHLERPFAAAISMGATRILGISSSTARVDRAHRRPVRSASGVESVLRSMLSVFNHDFMHSEVEQLSVLNRFAAYLDHGAPAPTGGGAPFNAVFDSRHHPCEYVPVVAQLISPSESLRGLADEFRREQGRSSRHAVPVGLLFHEDFTPRLIALGYEDACARHQDLEEFFHPTTTA